MQKLGIFGGRLQAAPGVFEYRAWMGDEQYIIAINSHIVNFSRMYDLSECNEWTKC